MKKILRFFISRVFWFSLLIVVQIGIFAVILFLSLIHISEPTRPY